MSFSVVEKSHFLVSGLKTELSDSQAKNFEIIKHHWVSFNATLKNKKVSFSKNWVKYGVTTRVADRTYYLSAIPSVTEIEGYESEIILAGKYLCFSHVGRMELIKSTISNIYKNVIPAANLNLDSERKIIHYEQYDARFSWNNPESVIDIYVPLKNHT